MCQALFALLIADVLVDAIIVTVLWRRGTLTPLVRAAWERRWPW